MSFLSFFFEKGKLYSPVTSPNWLLLGGLVDILKWFMLKVKGVTEVGSALGLRDSTSESQEI